MIKTAVHKTLAWMKMVEIVGNIGCFQIHNFVAFGQLFGDSLNWDGGAWCRGCWFRHKRSCFGFCCLCCHFFSFQDCGRGGGFVVVFLRLVVFSGMFVGNLAPENGLAGGRRFHYF